MFATTRLIGIAILVVGAMASASCNSVSATPPPTVCNGITSEAGGCDADRHVFTGSTCADLAREWGTALDAAVVAVIRGPRVVGDEGQGVLIKQKVVITSTDLNERLRALDLRASCDVPEVLKLGEAQFSPELRAGVGIAMYDGNPPASYDERRADLLRTIQVIDDEE